MSAPVTSPLVLAVTGAAGSLVAEILLERSAFPVTLVLSAHGRLVFEKECGPADRLTRRAARVFDDSDLTAPIASGTVPTAGMAILPCTTNTLGKIAGGLADTLITRAAHCHMKERRRLVLCVRETPWTHIDFENAARVTAAGAVVMPLSPPFYLFAGRPPETVTLREVLAAYVDRVLAQFGQEPAATWETVR